MRTPKVSISGLSVEHYNDSLGISVPSPRVTWSFESGPDGWTQASYTLTWNGQKKQVESDQSVLVPWPFEPLKSRQRGTLKVEVVGHDGSEGEAEVVIEAALLHVDDWSARLIGGTKQDPSLPKRPVRLRSTLKLDDFASARLYITAHGVFEPYLNGEKIGHDFMSPGWRDYRHFLPYSVYDVTHLLRKGDNVLGAWVGEGWYAGRMGGAAGHRNMYGEDIGLLAQLEVDGKVVSSTASDWEWSFGPIITSEIYDGEVYDSTISHSWTDGEWQPTVLLDPAMPSGHLFVSQSPPVREVETIRAKEVLQSASGKPIIDFGQNFAGVWRLLSEPPANKLVFRHAEVLEDGELCVRPLAYAKCTDTVTAGGPLKGYSPKFTYHGYRYVEVDGWPQITVDDIEGVFLATDMKTLGAFKSSHKVLNQLHHNVVYSTLSNVMSVPSDCPQRDERLGWTADIQVFANTMGYLFDCSGFLQGWLQDVYVEQCDAKGKVPIFVPILNPGADDALPQAAWSDVAVLLPHDLHRMAGDVGILEARYDSICMWLDKGVQRDPESNLWTRTIEQLSDWLAPSADPRTAARGPTDMYLVADAYLVHTTRIAAKVAGILGRPEEARYTKQAQEMLEMYYKTYLTPRGYLVTETQTALVLGIHFELFPADDAEWDGMRIPGRTNLAKRLAHLVTREFYQVSTGFLGTPIIVQTLAEYGYLAHAYRMLLAAQQPSWLCAVLLGATTTWERWDCMREDGTIIPGSMASFNHYALGSVASFLHEYIGGLSILEPGWKMARIRPQTGANLTWAETSHQSPYGLFEVKWKIEEGMLDVTAVVPPNTTALLQVPGAKDEVIKSGRYHRRVKWTPDPSWPPPVEDAFFAIPRVVDWVR